MLLKKKGLFFLKEKSTLSLSYELGKCSIESFCKMLVKLFNFLIDKFGFPTICLGVKSMGSGSIKILMFPVSMALFKV